MMCGDCVASPENKKKTEEKKKEQNQPKRTAESPLQRNGHIHANSDFAKSQSKDTPPLNLTMHKTCPRLA